MGSPRVVLAPMVAQSELAFRLLCRKYGAELCVTPMINARTFVATKHFQREVALDLAEARRPESLDRPLLVQLCGDDPDTLVQAALMVQDACDGVDLNLGCPQGIARRGHYGAFLLEETELVERIVATLAATISVPVTCKIRLLDARDPAPTVALCRRLVAAGASLITIHGRTRDMKGHFVGACNWDAIAAVRAALQGVVPVVANGGVQGPDDVQRCLDATRAQGVMISEASLSDPTVFRVGHHRSKIELALQYLDVVKTHAWAATHIGDARAHIIKLLFEIFQLPQHEAERLCIVSAATFPDLDAAVRALGAKPDARRPTARTWYLRHRVKAADDRMPRLAAPAYNPYALLDDDLDDGRGSSCEAPIASLFDDGAE